MSYNYYLLELLNIATNSTLNSQQKIDQIILLFVAMSEIERTNEGIYITRDEGMRDRDLEFQNHGFIKAANFSMCSNGWTLLCIAAKLGDLNLATWLVEVQGANVNKATRCQQSPLLIASIYNQPLLVDYLLTKGAPINQTISNDDTTVSGETILHRAALHGHIDVVRAFLAHGADIIPDSRGQTPIDLSRALLPTNSVTSDTNISDRLDNNCNSRPPTANIQCIIFLLNSYNRLISFTKCALNKTDLSAADVNAANTFMHLLLVTGKAALSSRLPLPITLLVHQMLYGSIMCPSAFTKALEVLQAQDAENHDTEATNSSAASYPSGYYQRATPATAHFFLMPPDTGDGEMGESKHRTSP